MPSDQEMQLNNFFPGGEEEEEEESEEIFEDEDVEDSDSPSTSSDAPTTTTTTITTIASQTPLPITTTIISPPPNLQTPQFHQRIEEKKPSAFDDSRRLFQRLWTDEDEVALLRGFLDYRTQRGGANHPSYHIDTGMFYDQIKKSLQLDFNKNQLVDKLRRLKKKYRNAINRITSGKEFSFKTPHDQTTFEIAHKIWGSIHGIQEDNDQKLQSTEIKNECYNGASLNNSDSRLPKRPRPTPQEDNNNTPNLPNVGDLSDKAKNTVTSTVIEETIRSCISPLIKELLSCSTNGSFNLGGYGGIESSPFPLTFGVKSFGNSEAVDDKWRKQQILELEVYSKRMELVQDQIKSALEELRSASS